MSKITIVEVNNGVVGLLLIGVVVAVISGILAAWLAGMIWSVSMMLRLLA
jgi:hypothetical protein